MVVFLFIVLLILFSTLWDISKEDLGLQYWENFSITSLLYSYICIVFNRCWNIWIHLPCLLHFLLLLPTLCTFVLLVFGVVSFPGSICSFHAYFRECALSRSDLDYSKPIIVITFSCKGLVQEPGWSQSKVSMSQHSLGALCASCAPMSTLCCVCAFFFSRILNGFALSGILNVADMPHFCFPL